VLRFNGTSWTRLTLPPVGALYGVWGSGAGHVVAVGAEGLIVSFNGSSWTVTESPVVTTLRAVWGLSAGDMWAVSRPPSVTDIAPILHFTSGQWRVNDLPRGQFNAVFGLASNNVYAVGEGGSILHYDGALWRAEQSGTTVPLRGVWAAAPDAVFVVGGDRSTGGGTVILRNVAMSWEPAPGARADPLFPHSGAQGVWGASASDVFVAGDAGIGTVARYDGAGWTMPLRSNTLRDVWGTGTHLFAVGEKGTALRSSGGEWTGMVTNSAADLYGVWASGPADAFAVGAEGKFRWNGSAWTRQVVEPLAPPARAVWGGSPTSVFAIDEDGRVRRYDGSSWTTARTRAAIADLFYGLWGLAEDELYAVGSNPASGIFGGILKYDGSRWLQQAAGVPAVLSGVWGSGVGDVVAVGARLQSTTPLVIRYRGVQWNPETVTAPGPLHDVWGTAANEIYAVGAGGGIVRYDGTGWTLEDSRTDLPLYGVWGREGGDWFAVGERGVILRGVRP
jgi:hypothetical protein